MRQIPILSDLFNYLTAPRLPRASLAISETHMALIALKRSGGDFEPRNLGVSRLPAGVLRASFTEPNVADEPALIDRLSKTASRAGMGNVKELSVSLPSGSARSEEHTSELQSLRHLVCRLLLEKKKKQT